MVDDHQRSRGEDEMYASGTAPGAAREPFGGYAPPAAAGRGDATQMIATRAAAAPDGDEINVPPDRIADGAGGIPGSPMQGLLAIFGDFLRAAFEQLGQMLAGLFANSPGAGSGGVAYQAAPSGAGDGAVNGPGAQTWDGEGPGQPDVAGAQGADAAWNQPPDAGGSQAPDGGGSEAADAAGRADGKHGHARAKGHGRGHHGLHAAHGGRAREPYQGGPLRPGQRLDLGEGESVLRRRDGALQITIGGTQARVFEPQAPPNADSTLMPSGLL
jgi:hypothetical protein